MKFKLGRYGIEITPETPADEAYIEDTLGLKENGKAIPLVRQGCIGSSSMAYLSTPSGYDRTKWYCETHGAFAARLASEPSSVTPLKPGDPVRLENQAPDSPLPDGDYVVVEVLASETGGKADG